MLGWLVACTGGPTGPAPAEIVVIADRVVEIEGGKIRAIHSPDSQAPVAIGRATQVLRAERVTAGFVDAHGHPDGLGNKISELDLEGAKSYADTLARIASVPPGKGFLLGRGWDQEDWPDLPPGGWPLAADLERLHPGRPISLSRVDGHAIWASQAALDLAQITAQTEDPSGGHIVRGEGGHPTGVLIDSAAAFVVPPPLGPEEEVRRMQAALVLLAAKGLTGVHAMGCSDRSVEILTALAQEGKLPVRLWLYVSRDSQAAKRLLAEGPWRVSGPDGSARLAVVGLKLIADGTLGSRSALLLQPYSDDPDNAGLARTSPNEILDLSTRALAAGVHVAVHAIGDRAIRETLDAFAKARAAHPERADVPLRIEHAQVVDKADMRRFAELSVIASMQPTHATSDAPWAEERLGPERIASAYAWKSLSSAGASLAFGSDFPVEAVDPALGLSAAVTRGGWHTEEAISLEEAIAAFTSGAAKAAAEPALGQLLEGMTADLTLWNSDNSGLWRAAGTIVGGEVITGQPSSSPAM